MFEFASPRPRVPVARGWRADLPWSQLVRQELEYARRYRSRVLICGESGTGRTGAIHSLADGEPVAVLDGSRAGEPQWLDQAQKTLCWHTGLVAIESIELVPPHVAAQLAEALDRGATWVAMTSSVTGESTEGRIALAARCARRIELPPLRSQMEEFATIVQAMSRRIRPDAPVRWTATALRLLAANPWPGNLRELRTVISDIVTRRSRGDITARDIPHGYQRSPKSRSLNLLERAEHDAIQSALRLSNGNKTHAATRLGISRTTLYKRINELGIPN